MRRFKVGDMGKEDPGFEASHVLREARNRITPDQRKKLREDTRRVWTDEEIKRARTFVKKLRTEDNTVQPRQPPP